MLLTLNNPLVTTRNHTSITSSHIDWQQFRNILENNISLKIPFKTNLDIDMAVQTFSSVIQNAALDASYTSQISQYFNNYLPNYISQLSLEKRRSRSKWQRSHLPSDLIRSLKNFLR